MRTKLMDQRVEVYYACVFVCVCVCVCVYVCVCVCARETKRKEGSIDFIIDMMLAIFPLFIFVFSNAVTEWLLHHTHARTHARTHCVYVCVCVAREIKRKEGSIDFIIDMLAIFPFFIFFFSNAVIEWLLHRTHARTHCVCVCVCVWCVCVAREIKRKKGIN